MATFGACLFGCRVPECPGTDHDDVGALASHGRRCVARRGDRVDRWFEVQRGSADGGMASDSQARAGRREAGAGEGDIIDLGTAVAAVTGQAQRSTVLRVLTGANDGHGHRITLDILDRLVVNHDAHARPTVANRRFPARVCREWDPRPTCETELMDPLAFHRQALDVAQHVVDSIDRSQFELPTPCDEWNVRQVLEHIIGGNRRVAGNPAADGEDVIGEDLSGCLCRVGGRRRCGVRSRGRARSDVQLEDRRVPRSLRGAGAVDGSARPRLGPGQGDRHVDRPVAGGVRRRLGGAAEPLRRPIGRSASFADEKPAPDRATAADRFAAFAGRLA